MGSHRGVGSRERKRWISSSETCYFPSALLLQPLGLLPDQREEKERRKGGGTAGEETHSSCYEPTGRGREMERGGSLPQ